MADAQPDASSASPVAETPADQAVASRDQAAFKRASRVERTAVLSDAVAASSPATPVDQAASTDASPAPASEPGKGKGPKARSAELDADIQEMREKLKLRATLREELDRIAPSRTDAPAASSPAQTVRPTDAITPDLSQPMLSEDDFFTRFPDAKYGQYGVYAAKYVIAEDRAVSAQQAQRQQIRQQWKDSAEAVKKEHDDFDVVLETAFDRLPDTHANRVINAALEESGNARLAYHLATHLDVTQRLVGLTPTAALVELGKLEASLTPVSVPVIPKQTTQTFEPPTTLGRRSADPVNDLDAAVASRDQSRFKEISLRERLAAVR